jgi:hypothetical protein
MPSCGMKSQVDVLRERIAEACRTTKPFTKQRNAALAKIKWRLESFEGLCAGLDDKLCCALVQPQNAMVFDGRDDEEMKKKWYEINLRVELALVLVDQPEKSNGRRKTK